MNKIILLLLVMLFIPVVAMALDMLPNHPPPCYSDLQCNDNQKCDYSLEVGTRICKEKVTLINFKNLFVFALIGAATFMTWIRSGGEKKDFLAWVGISIAGIVSVIFLFKVQLERLFSSLTTQGVGLEKYLVGILFWVVLIVAAMLISNYLLRFVGIKSVEMKKLIFNAFIYSGLALVVAFIIDGATTTTTLNSLISSDSVVSRGTGMFGSVG